MYNTVGPALVSNLPEVSRTIVTTVMYILTMLKKVFRFQVTHQFLTQKLHLNCKLPQCW